MKITLQETLNRLGKSQYWLAKQTGISAATINNLCNGKTSRIDFSVLQKICDALGCHINDIIASDDENVVYDNILRGPQSDLVKWASMNFDHFNEMDHIIAESTTSHDLKKLMDEYLKAVKECANIQNKNDGHK